MAQKTTLSILGVPGKVKSFLAKVALTVKRRSIVKQDSAFFQNVEQDTIFIRQAIEMEQDSTFFQNVEQETAFTKQTIIGVETVQTIEQDAEFI